MQCLSPRIRVLHIISALLGHRTVAVLQIKWRTLTASMVSLMISLHWVAIEIYRCMWDEGMMCLRISEQKNSNLSRILG